MAAFWRTHETFCARVLSRAWPCAGCLEALRGAASHACEGRALVTVREDGSTRTHVCDTGARPPNWLWLLLNVERALGGRCVALRCAQRALTPVAPRV